MRLTILFVLLLAHLKLVLASPHYATKRKIMKTVSPEEVSVADVPKPLPLQVELPKNSLIKQRAFNDAIMRKILRRKKINKYLRKKLIKKVVVPSDFTIDSNLSQSEGALNRTEDDPRYN